MLALGSLLDRNQYLLSPSVDTLEHSPHAYGREMEDWPDPLPQNRMTCPDSREDTTRNQPMCTFLVSSPRRERHTMGSCGTGLAEIFASGSDPMPGAFNVHES